LVQTSWESSWGFFCACACVVCRSHGLLVVLSINMAVPATAPSCFPPSVQLGVCTDQFSNDDKATEIAVVDVFPAIIDVNESQLAEDDKAEGTHAKIEGQENVAEQKKQVAEHGAVQDDDEIDEELALPALFQATCWRGPGQRLRRCQHWRAVINLLPTPTDWARAVHCALGADSSKLISTLARLNSSKRPLRLGTPCAGFEAPVFALQGLGLASFERSFTIDIAPHAATFWPWPGSCSW